MAAGRSVNSASPAPRSGVEMLIEMGIRAIRLGGSFTIPEYYAWYNW